MLNKGKIKAIITVLQRLYWVHPPSTVLIVIGHGKQPTINPAVEQSGVLPGAEYRGLANRFYPTWDAGELF